MARAIRTHLSAQRDGDRVAHRGPQRRGERRHPQVVHHRQRERSGVQVAVQLDQAQPADGQQQAGDMGEGLNMQRRRAQEGARNGHDLGPAVAAGTGVARRGVPVKVEQRACKGNLELTYTVGVVCCCRLS